MRKKVFVFIVTAVMILALIPVRAMAADTPSISISLVNPDGMTRIHFNSFYNSYLTFYLKDEDGNPVGNPWGHQSNNSREEGDTYILSIDRNNFQLTREDFGKTVSLSVVAVNGDGEITATAEGTVILTAPSLTLPSNVNISVIDKAKDLYDPGKISDITWVNGTCVTLPRVQKKQEDGNWTDVSDDTPLTINDIGLYRVRVWTVFGDFYSNEVTVDAYTIKFIDENGTELQTVKAVYDQTPEYTETLPTKPETDEYVYSFDGWADPSGTVYKNDALPSVKGDVTYTAVYSSKKILTITANDQSYMYNGKTQGEGDTVYADPAEISEKVTVEGLLEGDTLKSITLDGQGDEIKTYPLVPSSAVVGGVHGTESYDIRYVNGTLTITSNLFQIEFVNDDGTVLQSSLVAYGEMPKFEGEEPKKPETVQYAYSFAGWDPEITAVAGAETYTAKYDKTVRKYDLTFDLGGGTLNGQTGKITMTCEYGSKIKLPGAPKKDGYKFLYWKGSQYEAGAEYTVDGPHDFTAVWEAVRNTTPEKSPKTGDNSNMVLWAALLGCSLSALILLILISRGYLKKQK